MDEIKFQQAMKTLSGAFPRDFNLTPDVVAVWMRYLEPVDGDTLLDIVDGWVTTEERAPTIAGILTKAKGAVGMDAEAAWQAVIRAVTHGAYRSPTFSTDAHDRRIEPAVQAVGGWRRIGNTEEDRLYLVKRDFVTHYDRSPVPVLALAVR